MLDTFSLQQPTVASSLSLRQERHLKVGSLQTLQGKKVLVKFVKVGDAS